MLLEIPSVEDASQYPFFSALLVRHWFKWRILIFLVLNYYVIDCVLVPTFQAYYTLTMTTLLPLNILFLTILLTDLFFKFFMIPLRPAQPIKHIIKHYILYDWYFVDVGIFLLFLISFFLPYSSAMYFRLVIAFKLVEVIRFNEVIYKRFHVHKWVRQIYTIFKMIYVILLFSHYFGCAFYSLDQKLMELQTFGPPNENPQNYYMMESLCFTPISSLSDVEKYIYANYFITALITTIAYGDIIGKNYIQDTFVLFLLLLSTISIALILEQFMILMQNTRFALFQIIKEFNCVKEFMCEKNVPLTLQNDVRSYLFYVEYEKNFYDHEPILEKLPAKLKSDLLFQGYSKLILPCFQPLEVQDVYPLTTLAVQISFQAEYTVYQPFLDVDHFTQQSLLKPDLLFVVKGRAFNFFQAGTKINGAAGVKELILPQRSRTSAFNFHEFITCSRVRYGLRTSQLSKFIKISMDHFRLFLKETPTLQKIIRHAREQIQCKEVSNEASQNECLLCNQLDHSLQQCPDAHLIIQNSISRANKVENILKNRIQQARNHTREQRKSTKIKDLLPLSLIFKKIEQKVMKDNQNERVANLYLNSLAHRFREVGEIKRNMETPTVKSDGRDCIYDSEGLEQLYSV